MVDFSAYYILLAMVIIGINVIPAFMPPTWSVLVFFYLTYDLNAANVVVIGALCATFGRILLYFFAKSHFRRFLGKETKNNLAHFAKFVNRKRHISIPVFLAYAFSPLPSNQLYIMAGISGVHLRFIASIFLFGRFIDYSIWIGTAHLAVKSLEGLFGSYYSHTTTFLIEIIGFGLLFFLMKVNWKKYLKV